VHFVTGVPTTLGELAAMVLRLAESRASIVDAPVREFDVARFVGDPTRARNLLGWRAKTPLESGLARLVEDFRRR
jgi:nucleoside-diphosphate-sugar epimerase